MKLIESLFTQLRHMFNRTYNICIINNFFDGIDNISNAVVEKVGRLNQEQIGDLVGGKTKNPSKVGQTDNTEPQPPEND